MKLSQLFFKTFKSGSSEATVISQQLMERAGYIKKMGKGLYAYTPLMWRTLRKLMELMRQELNREGAQELHLPHLHPKALWEQTGRWTDFTSAELLYTLKDRENNEFCIGPTHEEMITAVVTDWVTSYKQLPLNLYQITHKFRDEIRPRFGLMRAKEFLMKDGYSFSDSPEMMESQYQAMYRAYSKIFERLKLKFVVVRADGGKIGKGKSQEFQVLAEIGEDTLMLAGDHASNIEATVAVPPAFSYSTTLLPIEEIETKAIFSIEALVKLTRQPAQQILKTVIFKLLFQDHVEYVMIGIRGDRQVNPTKVTNYFQALEVSLASDEEVVKITKAPVGFAGPLNAPVRYFADLSAQLMTNFIAAANRADIHFCNVNWGRDCPTPPFVDFLLAEVGDECPEVPEVTYTQAKGIEVGHIFNLGTKYSEAMACCFQDQEGVTRPFWMGTYGIGVGRVAAACVEQLHDEKGIRWPQEIAPYQILITAASLKEESFVAIANAIYEQCIRSGVDPLLDDRNERLGFKLKDSDLMGIPFKLIVGAKAVEEKLVEIESREGEKSWIHLDQLEQWISSHLLKTSVI